MLCLCKVQDCDGKQMVSDFGYIVTLELSLSWPNSHSHEEFCLLDCNVM
jgi:hypothetical protein